MITSRRSFLGASLASLTASRVMADHPIDLRTSVSITKAIGIWMLPKNLPYSESFRIAVEMGFEELEVQTVNSHKEAFEIKKSADKVGLRIHSVMNENHWKYPLSSPNHSEVEKGMSGMKTSLKQADFYGADTVLLVPGIVRDDTTYEQA